MPATTPQADDALRRFLHRVWAKDIAPLLRGPCAEQRRFTARLGGQLAATAGLALDSLLGLKGRPFARSLAVLGSTVGALLPDAWDWHWLREDAASPQRRVVAEQVERRAAELPLADALALFGLAGAATADQLKQAWREVSKRYHPDLAADERSRREYHVRFVAYRSAYDRLRAAYERGELPGGRP